jgi:hypothetical protein
MFASRRRGGVVIAFSLVDRFQVAAAEIPASKEICGADDGCGHHEAAADGEDDIGLRDFMRSDLVHEGVPMGHAAILQRRGPVGAQEFERKQQRNQSRTV